MAIRSARSGVRVAAAAVGRRGAPVSSFAPGCALADAGAGSLQRRGVSGKVAAQVEAFQKVQTMTCHNGSKAKQTFSASEMERRMGGLKGIMAADRLDAVVLTSMHNVCYYTDFLYCSFGRPYAAVVAPDGSSTTVSAGIDWGQPWRRSVGDNVTYTDWKSGNFYHAVGSVVAKFAGGCDKRLRIGVEFDHLTLAGRTMLEATFPQAELVDVSETTARTRMIKGPEEIAHIRKMTAIADLGGQAVYDAVAVGVAEHEVALAGTDRMVREIARVFPDTEIRDTWVWFQSGINTDGAHNPMTTRKLQRGDILSLNCFPMVQGYYVALERTMFVETCDDASLKAWEANVKVHRRGAELIRPGVKCSEVARELNEVFAETGFLQARTFGYGHSFGVLCHYYGREAGLELREDIETVLEPGMVVSIEPMITIPHGQPGAGGYREHDIFVVTESGSENITGFPFGPEHNIVPAK